MKAKSTAAIVLLIFAIFHLDARAEHEAEVIHWWVSGSERAALQTVIDAFKADGNRWIDTAVESSYYAKTAAISRITNGKPPTAVQWHTGVSLQELYKEGLFGDINELAEEQGWKEVLPAAIWANITVQGKIVAVPVTLHSSNWIWANRKILDEMNLDVPVSWNEFLQIAPKVAKAGYIPLAIGGESWQERALFLPIVLGTGGPQLYDAAFVQHNQEALSGPGMVQAFEMFGKFRQYADPDSPGRNWSDTTDLVIQGKAAFQVMGDWAKGEFLQAGMVPGKDFICAPSPGSSGHLLLVSDAFAMGNVQDPQVRASQLELAKTMMDKDVQKALNMIKGSIPPRTDIGMDGFDTCSRLAMTTASTAGAAYPGFSMANTGIVGSAIMSVISSFWNNPEMTPQDAAQRLAEEVHKAKR